MHCDCCTPWYVWTSSTQGVFGCAHAYENGLKFSSPNAPCVTLQVGGAPPHDAPTAWFPSNTDEVVMAMWNSNGSRPSCARCCCACASDEMNALKFWARLSCSGF